MIDPRSLRWALTSARVVVGTAVATGFVLALGTLAVLPFAGHAATPASVEAVPTPSDTVAVCAGPLLAAGRSEGDAAALGAAASQSLVAATASGDAPPPVALVGPSPEGAVAYVVPPDDRAAALVAAAGSASVAADDLRGLAASACRPPLFESWIVAGSGATGAGDLVTLANPGAVAATATVSVYGTGGAVTAPGGTDVVVSPGTQVVVPLAGLRLGEATPVVRVVASGAPVAATLQSSITRTLLPGGVEESTAALPPDGTAVIPGVVVPEGVTPGAEPGSVLRLVAPSSDGTATVSLVRADGAAAPADQQVPLVAGQPVEVDLGALAAGVWTVRVSADAAVAAAVRQATGFGEGADFAWFSAAPDLTGTVLAAVADGPSPVLALANPGGEQVRVTVRTSGESAEVVVPAGGAASLPLAAGATLVLEIGDAVLQAAIGYSGAGALSGYALWPGDAAAPAITVFP